MRHLKDLVAQTEDEAFCALGSRGKYGLPWVQFRKASQQGQYILRRVLSITIHDDACASAGLMDVNQADGERPLVAKVLSQDRDFDMAKCARGLNKQGSCRLLGRAIVDEHDLGRNTARQKDRIELAQKQGRYIPVVKDRDQEAKAPYS